MNTTDKQTKFGSALSSVKNGAVSLYKNPSRHQLLIIIYGLFVILLAWRFGYLFGSEYDWLCQHTVFPDTFRQKFYETGKLLPNLIFNTGGGQNIFNFAYYGLLSPLFLPSYLLPFVDMTYYVIAVSVIVYLSIGILAYRFLRHHFGAQSALLAAIIFMTMPPVNFHMHRHIMFVWYLPFILLALIGIDRIFEKKKSLLFIVSAFCLIMTNYFYSVGSLICLFIYALYRLLSEERFTSKAFWKRTAPLVLTFAIPVLLSAFFLLPTAYSLLSNGRATDRVIPIASLLLPHLDNAFFGSYSLGLSAVMLVAVVGNFLSKSLTRADLFFNVCLVVLLFFSPLTYALNGFLYVRGKALIPFGILFVYNFCAFLGRLEAKTVPILKTLLISLGIAVAIWLANACPINSSLGVIGEIAFLILVHKRKAIIRATPFLALFIATAFYAIAGEALISVKTYRSLYNEEAKSLIASADKGVHRTDVLHMEHYTVNRMYGKGSYSTNIYSSTANKYYLDFYRFGLGNNQSSDCDATQYGVHNELFYTFMGTKYIVADRDPGFYYSKVKDGEHLSLYENKNAFPIFYKGLPKISRTEFEKLTFPYSAVCMMNYTVVDEDVESSSAITDISALLTEKLKNKSYSFVNDNAKAYTITLDESYRNKLLYLSFDIADPEGHICPVDRKITVNGIQNQLSHTLWLYYNDNTNFQYVIPMENTTTLEIEVSEGNFNIENLSMYTSEVIYSDCEPAENITHQAKNDKFSCKASAKAGDILATTLPYDDGYTVYVNGKKTDPCIVNTAFMGIPLTEGENSVVIEYDSPFLKEGALVSIFGSALLILFVGFEEIKKRRTTK